MILVFLMVILVSISIHVYFDIQIKKQLTRINMLIKSMREEHPVIKAALDGDPAALEAIKTAFENIRKRKLKRRRY